MTNTAIATTPNKKTTQMPVWLEGFLQYEPDEARKMERYLAALYGVARKEKSTNNNCYGLERPMAFKSEKERFNFQRRIKTRQAVGDAAKRLGEFTRKQLTTASGKSKITTAKVAADIEKCGYIVLTGRSFNRSRIYRFNDQI